MTPVPGGVVLRSAPFPYAYLRSRERQREAPMTASKKSLGLDFTQTEVLAIAERYCRVECELFNRLVDRLSDNGLLMVAEATAKPDRHRSGDGAR